ncbi:MAG: alpha/beta fold hydrolase [Janthinobacterium lividum]
MKKFSPLFAAQTLVGLAALGLLAGSASAQATSGSVTVGSAKIAYRVQGHGPAMMLVHGYPLSGELFAKNRAALSRRYTVVTPDLRGFGDSTTPDTKGGVELYAKDMLAVMDHLHVQKAIIGGMSMGGPVVLEMYREAPQRFRGMILIDSTSSPANDVEKAQWPGFGDQARDKGVASMIPVLMPQMLTTATRMSDPALIKFVGGIVKKGSVDAAVGGGSTLATRPDSRPTLAHVKVPVLFVVGSDDPIYPVEMDQKMHQDTPGSRLAIIPGAAHAAIIEKPEACNRAIEAWASSVR